MCVTAVVYVTLFIVVFCVCGVGDVGICVFAVDDVVDVVDVIDGT